jgi:hypothetical protein
MYLHGMSTGDFTPTLGEFFGSAADLSASVITRLTRQWQSSQFFVRFIVSPRRVIYSNNSLAENGFRNLEFIKRSRK